MFANQARFGALAPATFHAQFNYLKVINYLMHCTEGTAVSNGDSESIPTDKSFNFSIQFTFALAS